MPSISSKYVSFLFTSPGHGSSRIAFFHVIEYTMVNLKVHFVMVNLKAFVMLLGHIVFFCDTTHTLCGLIIERVRLVG